ncbi:hypothetical protein [Pedobacter nyackensis]|uniref:Uncharacterized protein n=1 Tax=Pedobacter nyackensis TaxID=475255 RepID=A0A1W1ZXX8_9SPHI|nr:hypothetical protein [Pedobacter nyackensis]SMC53349.1 hypothetical protein SAMN04488101_101149 [Pedobacter nyackensis]
MYELGGFDLLNAGFIPIVNGDSNVALSGFLDMPARLGKTHYDWAGEVGIEPYVSASEIFFGGRALTLTGVVTGADQYECNDKVSAIYRAIDGFTDLVPLVTEYGTYNVFVNAAIAGEYMPDAGQTKGIKLTIPMREPVVSMPGVVPIGTNSEFGIDGISFLELGGEYIQLEGDRRNRTAPKGENASVYGKESYLITNPVAPELKLKIAIKQPTYAGMKEKADAVMALFAKPGMRSLTVNNDRLRSFFVKDGFKASRVYIKDEFSFCLLECSLTESGIGGTFADLVDALGNRITNNEGDIIRVRI